MITFIFKRHGLSKDFTVSYSIFTIYGIRLGGKKVIINCTEIAVREIFPEVLESYKKRELSICTCQRCLDDIVALALNYLPPHYVATEKGAIITKVDFQKIGGRTEVFTQIYHAVKKVSENPRH